MGALNFLIEVMQKLNDNPGMFETFQKELNSIYIEFSHNEFVISNAIEIIFDQVRTHYMVIFNCIFIFSKILTSDLFRRKC